MTRRRTYRAPRRPKVKLWPGQPVRPAGALDDDVWPTANAEDAPITFLEVPPLVLTPLAHEQGERETKVATDGALLARIRCTCGWTGCWFETDYAIERSWARHAEHAAKERHL